MKKLTLLLIASLFFTTNISGQDKVLLYLYLESKDGNILEIPFTDGTITVMNSHISIDMPRIQYAYDDIERFYFKDKNHLALSSLAVSEGSLIPEFSSDIFSYTVNVPDNTTSAVITATASDSKATVTGAGLKELTTGANPFTITVTAEDGVTTLNYTVTVNNVTGNRIADHNDDLGVRVYPNPTAGKFTVRIPDGLSISIYNTQGQKFEDRILADEYTDLDIGQYPKGVYILSITTRSGQSITKQLVKQ